MKTDVDDARCTLAVLLRMSDDPPVLGLEELSEKERSFLKVTCAVTVMLHEVCRVAGYRPDLALEGLDALELRQHIKTICGKAKR